MLKAKDYPAKACLYCGKRMNLSLDMQILLAFEPPMKVISSGGDAPIDVKHLEPHVVCLCREGCRTPRGRRNASSNESLPF